MTKIISTNWKIKKLSEVCEKITDGSHNPPKGIAHSNYLMLSSKNIIDDTIIFDSPRFLTENDFNNENKRTDVKPGNVLLTIVGTIGRVAIVPDSFSKFTLQRSVAVLKNKKGVINSSYLMRSLQNIFDEMNKNSRGVAQKGLYLNQIRNLEIPVPPLLEQQHIVAILDKAFSTIDKAKSNAEQNLKNARAFFVEYLANVFSSAQDSWKSCKIEDHISFIDYRGKTPKKTILGLRLITAKNIKNGFIQQTPEEFINPADYDTWMTRGIPKKDDVLFTTEAPLANVAQLDSDEKVAFAQRIIIMQPQRDVINPTFLKYLLLSKPIKQKILEKGTGATVQGIKASLLKKIDIYFPKSLTEQLAITNKLDLLSTKTKQLESNYYKMLTHFEELKKSILQKAFSGELTNTNIDKNSKVHT